MRKYIFNFLFICVFSLFMLVPFKVSAMEIFIKTFTGENITIDVEPNESIGSIKLKIQEKINKLPEEQRLIFAGTELENEKTISDYNISKESTLHLLYKTNLINVKYNIQNLNATTNNVDENGPLEDGSYNVLGTNDFTAKLEPIESYKLPSEITVYINEKLIETEKYNYNSVTGDISINKDLLDGDIVITAVAEKIQYKVVLDANGGKFADSDKYIIDDIINFDYFNFNKPTRSGYQFIGFFTDKTSGKSFENVMNSEAGIEKDTTFYARWKELSGSGVGTKEPDVENPNTFDGIVKSIFMIITSLFGLIGTIIYLLNESKERAF